MTYQEAIDHLINGNTSVFKAWLKRARKLDLVNAIEYYSDNIGKRQTIINTIRALRERRTIS